MSIPLDLWSRPTTQKAVVNAVVSTGLCRDLYGYREVYVDNCYYAPEIFVMLKIQY